jgi:hypothetical protein
VIPFGFHEDGLLLEVARQAQLHLFQVVDEVRSVLHDLGNRLVLAGNDMGRAVVLVRRDLHGADGIPLDRGQQDPAQRVADGDAVAPLEGVRHKAAVVGFHLAVLEGYALGLLETS